ncbi:DsrE family protein [Thiocapsa roseopersicina]|uniref:DsrE family protein n=1 Tax=Thiocapsa roseopersicina TaxID=1058 RepID=UPI001FE0EE23|nr:DsrE family protein [Thiocapsa roseopersicina]
MAQKISIVCVSGAREKLQMAAMIASVAAASGDEVTVFFSMNALQYFVKGQDCEAPPEGAFGVLIGKHAGVPPFKQLFAFAADIGDAKLLPCSMALDLLGIKGTDLDPEFGPPTGLTSFLSDISGSQLFTF